jgi:hypothetical protein
MEFLHTDVFNFKAALRGMRNPLNSWKKSDSLFDIAPSFYDVVIAWAKKEKPEYYSNEYLEDLDELSKRVQLENKYEEWLLKNGAVRKNDYNETVEVAFIGPNDMDLAQRLVKAGPEHRKFLRQIMVSVDITAPIYWWKEFDTYKIGTVANSTSTMHKLASTPITLDCFEIDDLDVGICKMKILTFFIGCLEKLRKAYLSTSYKGYWKELIRWLPMGWKQTRTVTMNYENLRSMYFQRKNHKLTEWHQFIAWVETLPYAEELIKYTGKKYTGEETLQEAA